jgi:polysaccharide deacetylase family protein (PEP-CTERM system associated)
MTGPNIMTIDVEEWFHILDIAEAPDVARWDALESRVERNVDQLLTALGTAGARATCFVLGWVAEKHPQIVRKIVAEGHEIAAHGDTHQLAFRQGREAFRADIRKVKRTLEDVSGVEVVGYRAPGFSITSETPWAFEEVVSAGYRYDSSLFPASRGHGGLPSAPRAPFTISTPSGDLLEIPLSVVDLFGARICFFGGGYLRLFPYAVIRAMRRRVNEEGLPVVYYIHPREIDPGHPRLKMPLIRRFKSYVNLSTTMPKLRRILEDDELVSCRDWIAQR